MPNGSSALTSLTSAVPSATLVGSLQGTQHISVESIGLFQKCSEAKNIFKEIQQSILDFKSQIQGIENNFSGLDVFKPGLGKDLFDAADFSRQQAAKAPVTASHTIASVIGHGALTVSDVSIGAQAGSVNVSKLLDVENPSKASELKVDNHDNFFACSKHFIEQMNPLCAEIERNVNICFVDHNRSALSSHVTGAMSTAGTVSIASAAPLSVISMAWDTVGASLRSLQRSFLDTAKSDEQHAQVWEALNQCISSTNNQQHSKESCLKSLENLKNLIHKLGDIEPSNQQIANELATGTQPTAKASSIASIPLVSGTKLTTNSTLGSILASEAIPEQLATPGLQALSKQASSLEENNPQIEQQNLQAGEQNPQRTRASQSHSKNIISLTEQFKNINQVLSRKADEIPAAAIDKNLSEAETVKGAGFAITLSAAVSSLSALLPLELGSFTREKDAAVKSMAKPSDGLARQSKVVNESKDNVGEEFDKLFLEASKTQDALDMAKELGASSPFILGLTRAAASISAIGSLHILLGSYSALKEIKSAVQTAKNLPDQSKLNAEEKQKVASSVGETKQVHQKASSAFTTSAVNEMSSENALEAVLNKVILMRRVISTGQDQGEAKDRKDLNSVGRASVGAENGSATAATHAGEFLTGTLSVAVLAFLESGITGEATLRALYNVLHESYLNSGNIKELSEGPDKTKINNNSATNMSSLSNALRLFAASKLNDAPSLQSAVVNSARVSESISGRSLTVLLIHSGILSDAVSQLTEQHQVVGEQSKSRGKTKDSAREQVLNRLAAVIEERLNNLPGQPIPGLNKDMASQLQSLSKGRIISALSSEITLIEPFLVLSGLLNHATKNARRHENEAVTGSKPFNKSSVASNLTQGFTLACLDAKDIEHRDRDADGQLLISTHHSAGRTYDKSFVSSGSVSLLLEESISLVIGRAYTLLDSKRINNKSTETYDHSQNKLNKNLKLATKEIKQDSRLNQPNSAIHGTAAMRSTMTHFCEALKDCAHELALKVDDSQSDNFLKDGLEMHSSEKAAMRSLSWALLSAASIMTRAMELSSGISFSHIIALGKVDQVHRKIHSTDKSLGLHQSDFSQESTKANHSQSTLATGLSTDLAVSAITNLVKILLRASIMGADVLLSVSKVLEILMLDIHPSDRLRNEIEALCVPNIGTQGASQTLNQATLATEIIPSISTGQASATQTDDCLIASFRESFNSLQALVNNKIEQMQVLKDEDEHNADTEHKGEAKPKGIKGYIREILKTLVPRINEQQLNAYIDRLDKGGCSISNYHTHFGGITATTHRDEPIHELSKTDDVKALIKTFIDKMADEFNNCLNSNGIDTVQQFNKALGNNLTPQAKKLHNYIIDQIARKLYLYVPFARRESMTFNEDGFIEDYSYQTPDRVIRNPRAASYGATGTDEVGATAAGGSTNESKRSTHAQVLSRTQNVAALTDDKHNQINAFDFEKDLDLSERLLENNSQQNQPKPDLRSLSNPGEEAVRLHINAPAHSNAVTVDNNQNDAAEAIVDISQGDPAKASSFRFNK